MTTEGFTTNRRDLIKKGAVAGAVVWAAPVILSQAAGAQGTPPACDFRQAWTFNDPDVPNVPPNGFQSFDTGAPIGTTGWNGANGGVDVVGPTYPGSPGWVNGNWVDLINLGTTGGMATMLTLPCTGCYQLEFTYSKYGPLDTDPSMIVNVGGTITNSGPVSSTSQQPFTQTYAGLSGQVTISITSTGTGNIGVAGDDFVLTYLGPTCPTPP